MNRRNFLKSLLGGTLGIGLAPLAKFLPKQAEILENAIIEKTGLVDTRRRYARLTYTVSGTSPSFSDIYASVQTSNNPSGGWVDAKQDAEGVYLPYIE